MNFTSFTWHHAWWIPSVIAYYIGYSWLSKLTNDQGHVVPWYTSKHLWVTFAFGALCPFWVIVSRVSKNILFDGMLYDNIMFLTYITTLIVLKSGDKFLPHHWIGLGLVVLGSVLMRISV